MKVQVTLPRMHQAQKEILLGQKRFNTVNCGRRFGKSVIALDRLVDDDRGCLRGFPVAYFAPQYKLAEQMFRDLKLVLAPVIVRADASQKRIELVGGGSVDVWTLQDEDAGRSRKYSVAVVDEAAHVPDFEPIWSKAIRPTLSDFQGSAWFLSTPNGYNYYKTLYDKGDNTTKFYDPDWISWCMPTSRNPYIKPEEILAAQKDLPSLAFEQEYLARFISIEGALLRASYFKQGEPPVAGRTVVGCDLAISQKTSADYTVILVLTQTPDGNIYIREVVRFRGTFNDIILEIKRVAAKWTPSVIGIEKVQFQAAIVQELLRTTQLNAIGIVPIGDKVERFQPLVSRYEQGLIFHSPLVHPDFEKELLQFPVGSSSPDQVDALSMAFKSLSYSSAPLLTLTVGGL